MEPKEHPGLRGDARARVIATPHTVRLPLSGSSAAVEVLERLADGGRQPGALLLESADLHAPEGRRTLLAPAPVLRVVLRGEAMTACALDARGEALLPLLRDAWGGESGERSVTAVVQAAPTDPAMPDRERLRAPSCLDMLRDLLRLVADDAPAEGLPVGLYGAFGYEFVDRFESLPPRRPDPYDEPDLNLVLALDGIVHDHEREEVVVVTRDLRGVDGAVVGPQDAATRAAAWAEVITAAEPARVVVCDETVSLPDATPDLDDQEYRDRVESLLDHVVAGDIFQCVLSRSLSVRSEASPLDVYRHLRARNPSPYMFHFDLGDGTLLGASPETCVRCEAGELTLSPIAGTVARGFHDDGAPDLDRDVRLAIGLLLDRKEQAEHAMLIDLARNDVARISVPGTREVFQPFSVERFSHVQHLVSRVRGRLDPELDALDAYRACANMGTLTGAPKLRATELIRQYEATARGYYGGGLGYVTREGDLDSCIVIRSLRW
ncbi:MAG: chorismate-binding protein, partial [Planctomycetes bacterium]|nr:chorismate-binding protein [Planctomycetota bacterium]